MQDTDLSNFDRVGTYILLMHSKVSGYYCLDFFFLLIKFAYQISWCTLRFFLCKRGVRWERPSQGRVKGKQPKVKQSPVSPSIQRKRENFHNDRWAEEDDRPFVCIYWATMTLMYSRFLGTRSSHTHMEREHPIEYLFTLQKKVNFQLPTQKVTAPEFIFMLIVCFAYAHRSISSLWRYGR